MADEKSPAFQFYPKDFFSDGNVAQMSLQERGAYITLLCVCWNDGSLPADVTRLARIAGATAGQMQKMWPAVGSCFRPHPTDVGRLVHPRLEKEREKQERFRRRQSDKGKASAASRAATEVQPNGNRGSTVVQPEPQPNVNSSISDLQTPVAIAKNAIARARERGTNPTDFTDAVLSRVNAFIERYKLLYQKHRKGAHYVSKPQLDFPEAALLCETWDDERLDKLAAVFLTTDHDFAENGSRTLAQFRAMASWCDSRLREKNL